MQSAEHRAQGAAAPRAGGPRCIPRRSRGRLPGARSGSLAGLPAAAQGVRKRCPAFAARRAPRDVCGGVAGRLGALLLATLLVACAGPARDGRPTLTLAWVTKSLGNPVFDHGLRGAQQKAAELSAQGPYRVELVAVGPTSADAVEQTRVLDDLTARRVDGIAVSCNDPTACIDPIGRAVAAGIPVMTWDSDAPASRRFTFLSIDNYVAGRRAAELLLGAVGETGKVAIITGVPGGLNLEQRVAGFRDVLAAHPGITIVAEVATNEDISRGVQGVEDVMQAHPDLRGWFFAGMWPLFADRGAMPLWEQATRAGRLKTVSFDTLPFQLELLRDGYLTALIGQKYWGWGYDSIQIVYDQVVGARQHPPFIDTGMDIVTARNVGAMIRAWETNDFQTPLPPP